MAILLASVFAAIIAVTLLGISYENRETLLTTIIFILYCLCYIHMENKHD